MASIELFDQKRRAYYRGFVFSFTLFAVIWVLRLILKWTGVVPRDLDSALLVAIALTIPFQFYFSMKLNALRSKAKNEPELNALFQDELVKFHALRAWKSGFIAMVCTLGIFAVLSIFHLDFKDLPAVLFTILWAGVGGYHLSFYRLERE
jgi:hypothetical protein